MTVYLPKDLETLSDDIIRIVNQYVDLKNGYELFFFGSRVTGKHKERSDIDIGVRGRAPLPRDKVYAIREAIEHLPTLYKIDFVDFGDVSKDMKDVGLQNIHIFKKYE